MKLTILSIENDLHAPAMRDVILSLGLDAIIVNDDDFPRNAQLSIYPDACDIVHSKFGNISQRSVIWSRKIGRSILDDSLSEDEKSIAQSMNDKLIYDIRALDLRYWPPSIWINPHSAQMLYENKINQLVLAHKLGFNIPASLISNDAKKIADFAASHAKLIIKPLYPMSFGRDGQEANVPTSAFSMDDVTDDRELQLCPMIYQEQIERKYDLRVIVFGSEIIAVKVLPSKRLRREIDWRPTSADDVTLELMVLPNNIRKQIQKLCMRANLLHCSIDFGITLDDQLVFFEINVQGQWLWIELMNDSIKMLDHFARMIFRTMNLKDDFAKQISCQDFITLGKTIPQEQG